MRYLWRLEGNSINRWAERWASGIAIHLRYQPLTTVLVWREQHLRRYLVLDGCPRCQPGGCVSICPRSLFQQLMRTSVPGITLAPVPRLVAGASEQDPLVALPSRTAGLLDPAFLGQWGAATLVTTWRQGGGKRPQLRIGARLTVSREGPPLVQALRAVGWRVDPLATWLARRQRPLPVPRVVVRHGEASSTLHDALRDPQQCLALAPAPDREAA